MLSSERRAYRACNYNLFKLFRPDSNLDRMLCCNWNWTCIWNAKLLSSRVMQNSYASYENNIEGWSFVDVFFLIKHLYYSEFEIFFCFSVYLTKYILVYVILRFLIAFSVNEAKYLAFSMKYNKIWWCICVIKCRYITGALFNVFC